MENLCKHCDGALRLRCVNDAAIATSDLDWWRVTDADFDAFYRRNFSRAVSVAHALAGARVAEDIAQDAFTAAYRRWSEIDEPERWLIRVVANRSRSVLRRRYAEAKALARIGGDSGRAAEIEEPADELWAVVRRLPRRQAQVIALTYVDELTTKELAAVLGCSEATVRVHLHRGRQSLARRFNVEV